VLEIERRERRDSRRDPHPLHPEQQQRRPQQVDELGGQKQGAKRNTRREALGAKSDGKVTNEH